MDLAFDDRRVGDDPAVDIEDEMPSPETVLPVVLGEAAIIVLGEGGPKNLSQAGDLGARQLVAPQRTDVTHRSGVDLCTPEGYASSPSDREVP